MALVIVVVVVGGRGYGDVRCLDGISSLAGGLNCEGGGKGGKRSVARFQCPDGVNRTVERSRVYVAYDETGDVLRGEGRERTAGGDEKHLGNHSAGSKQLQQQHKGGQRARAQGLVEIRVCDISKSGVLKSF